MSMKRLKYYISFFIILCAATALFKSKASALDKVSSLIWPVDPQTDTYWITALDYYYDVGKHGSSGMGIDIYKDPNGDGKIYAIADGEIVERVNECPHTSAGEKHKCGEVKSSYGNYIKIRHNDGSYSLYAHLQIDTLTKKASVKAGEEIAIMGSSGSSTGVHLHLEIFTPDNKKDYTFDYFKNNIDYQKKFAFRNGLQDKSERYKDWIRQNYKVTKNFSPGITFLSYSGNSHSNHTYDNSGYCTIGGEEFPISLQSVPNTKYQIINDNTLIRKRPYKTGEVVKTLNKGAIITVIAQGKNTKGNTWYMLVLDDGYAWVYSENVKKLPKPKSPTGFKITKTGSKTANLSWNPVSGATYEVQYNSPSSGGWKTDPDYKDKSSTSYTTSGLSDKTYQFRVRAVTSTGESDWITITYEHTTGNLPTASKPVSPTGFTMTRVDEKHARLSWNPVSGATSYEVEYNSPTSGGWKTDPDYKDKSSTSYTTSGLSDKTYQFRVRAVTSTGESDWITITYEHTTGNLPTASKPVSPTGFTMTRVDEKHARLSWNPVSGATSYEVEYNSPTSGGWKTDPDYKDKSSTSYTTSGLNPKIYQFRVRAVNSAGTSEWVTIAYDHTGSNSPATSRPARPTGFTMTRVDEKHARLSWNPVSGATSYEVEYNSPTSGGWKTDPDYKDKSSTSYTTSGLNSKIYQFRVRAVNSAGTSEWVTITYDGSTGNSWQ